MVHYRLYSMSIADGGIESARDIDAPDDQAAISIAARLLHHKPIEIWCGAREVHRVETTSRTLLDSYLGRRGSREDELSDEVVQPKI